MRLALQRKTTQGTGVWLALEQPAAAGIIIQTATANASGVGREVQAAIKLRAKRPPATPNGPN